MMTIFDHLALYTEPWNGNPSENRETFIGGSDVGTIMGLNPFKSPYELFLEKTRQIERENLDDKLQVRLGHKMEQVVAELYEEETGCKVQQSNKSFRSKEFPFLIGHIDRKIVGKKKGLEIKTTSSFNKTDYEDGVVPPSHYYQCMFYMMITGMHDWDLATLRDNREFHITHVEWNEGIAEDMLEKCIDFWDCVVNKTWDKPLDGSDATTEILDKAYTVENKYDTSSVPISSNNTGLNVADYMELKKAYKQIGESITAFENNVKAVLGSSQYGIIDNEYSVSWRQCTRSGGIDFKAFQKDHPEIDFEMYRKPDTEYRRFAIKKAKPIHKLPESEEGTLEMKKLLEKEFN